MLRLHICRCGIVYHWGAGTCVWSAAPLSLEGGRTIAILKCVCQKRAEAGFNVFMPLHTTLFSLHRNSANLPQQHWEALWYGWQHGTLMKWMVMSKHPITYLKINPPKPLEQYESQWAMRPKPEQDPKESEVRPPKWASVRQEVVELMVVVGVPGLKLDPSRIRSFTLNPLIRSCQRRSACNRLRGQFRLGHFSTPYILHSACS